MEAGCEAICSGTKGKDEMVKECLRDMKRVFQNILLSKQMLEGSMAARFEAAGQLIPITIVCGLYSSFKSLPNI